MSDINTAYAFEKFRQQRWRSHARGIEWDLSFDDWLSIWAESGKWHLRGRGVGKYVMSRIGDVGPYSKSNVFINLWSANVDEARHKIPALLTGSGRGWTFRSGKRYARRPYQVMCADRYIGSFSTQEEAEAAYAIAVIKHRESIGSLR